MILWPRLTFYVVILATLALDQATKAWASHVLRPLLGITVVPGLLELTYVRNTGIAFGLFAGQGILVGLLIFVVVLFAIAGTRGLNWARREPNLVGGLLIGGALGNLIDRARFGYVVDFCDAHLGAYHWPVFNVADSAICCAVGWILFRTLFRPAPAAIEPRAGRETPDEFQVK